MWTTETDREFVFYAATSETARKLRIKDVEFKERDELFDDIRLADTDTYHILKSFVNEWNSWFEFHLRIERAGKAGNLSEEERRELHVKIMAKESARVALTMHTLRAVRSVDVETAFGTSRLKY